MNWLCAELRKYDHEFDARDRRACSDVVWSAIDNFFTENMIWTKRKMEFPPEFYLKLMPVSIDRHVSPYDLVDELVSRVAVMMSELAEFPTWHYFEVQRRHNTAAITMGTDFRIDFFMEHHAKEYGVGKYSW